MKWNMQWDLSVHNMLLPLDQICCLDKSELEACHETTVFHFLIALLFRIGTNDSAHQKRTLVIVLFTRLLLWSRPPPVTIPVFHPVTLSIVTSFYKPIVIDILDGFDTMAPCSISFLPCCWDIDPHGTVQSIIHSFPARSTARLRMNFCLSSRPSTGTLFVCLTESVRIMQSYLSFIVHHLPQEAHAHQQHELMPHEAVPQPVHSAQQCGSFGRLAEQSPLTGNEPNQQLITISSSARSTPRTCLTLM